MSLSSTVDTLSRTSQGPTCRSGLATGLADAEEAVASRGRAGPIPQASARGAKRLLEAGEIVVDVERNAPELVPEHQRLRRARVVEELRHRFRGHSEDVGLSRARLPLRLGLAGVGASRFLVEARGEGAARLDGGLEARGEDLRRELALEHQRRVIAARAEVGHELRCARGSEAHGI
jgi:hypothetical protein